MERIGFRKSKNFLSEINQIEIPRKLVDFSSKIQSIELHGFIDASLKCYGACIFIRSVTKDEKIDVNLVAAKSRVVPIKSNMTIPKLELMGTLILSRLTSFVKTALKDTIPISNIFYWSDSKVSLSWIKAHDKEFVTFVENRVQEIRTLTNYENWFHCITTENPAVF